MDSSARRRLVAACAALAMLSPLPAMAYIDPNSSGLLFQLLAPVVTAAIGAWVFMRRTISEAVRSLWRRLTGKPEQ